MMKATEDELIRKQLRGREIKSLLLLFRKNKEGFKNTVVVVLREKDGQGLNSQRKK